MSQNQKILEAITVAACKSLFEDYDTEIKESSHIPRTGELQYCGVIGFSGELARGTLLLAMERHALLDVLPQGGATDESAARDWLAELTNQLLGRIKNQLVRRDLEVFLTMPFVLSGEYVVPLPASLGLSFMATAGEINVWVEAEFEEGYLMPEQECESATLVACEGETLMF